MRRAGRWVPWAAGSLAVHIAVLTGGFLLLPVSDAPHRGPMVVSVEWVPVTPAHAAPPSSPVSAQQRERTHAVAHSDVGRSMHAKTADAVADAGHMARVPAAHSQAPATKPASTASDQTMTHNLSLVRQHLERFKFYPDSARRRGIGGNVDVGFRLTDGGRVAQLKIAASSGYALLDEAAESIVERAVPFPVDTGQYRVRLRFWP